MGIKPVVTRAKGLTQSDQKAILQRSGYSESAAERISSSRQPSLAEKSSSSSSSQAGKIVDVDGDKVLLETKEQYDTRTAAAMKIATPQDNSQQQSYRQKMIEQGYLRRSGTPESTMPVKMLQQLKSGELKSSSQLELVPQQTSSGGYVYVPATEEASLNIQRRPYLEAWARKRVFSPHTDESPLSKYTGMNRLPADAVKLDIKKQEAVQVEPGQISSAEKKSRLKELAGRAETAIATRLTQNKYSSFRDIAQSANSRLQQEFDQAMVNPYIHGAVEVVAAPGRGIMKLEKFTRPEQTASGKYSTFTQRATVEDYISLAKNRDIQDVIFTAIGARLLSGAPVIAKLPFTESTLKFGKGLGVAMLADTQAAEPIKNKISKLGLSFAQNRESAGDTDMLRSFRFANAFAGTPASVSEGLNSPGNSKVNQEQASSSNNVFPRHGYMKILQDIKTFGGKSYHLVKGAGNYVLMEGGKLVSFAAEKPISFYSLGKAGEIAGAYAGSIGSKALEKFGLEQSPRANRFLNFASKHGAGIAYYGYAVKTAPEGKKLKTAVGFAGLPVLFKGAELGWEGAKVGADLITKDFYRQFETDPTGTFLPGKSNKQGFAPREQVINPEIPPRINPAYRNALENIQAEGKAPGDILIKTYSAEDAIIKRSIQGDENIILAGSRNFYSQLKGIWDTKGKDWDFHARDNKAAAEARLRLLQEANLGMDYSLASINTDSGKVFRIMEGKREVADFAPLEGKENPITTGEGIKLQSLSQELWTKARTSFEPAKVTGRAREKDIPKLLEGLENTKNSIVGKYMELISGDMVKSVAAKDVVYYENVGWHAGDFASSLKDGVLTPKILTPSKAESAYGESAYPILYLGQNERLSYFYKGGQDTLRLSGNDIKVNKLADLPKEFQAAKGTAAQASAYLDWVQANKQGEIVPSAKTVAGIDFKTGKSTSSIEKEWIIMGDIKGINQTGFMLDYYSPWGQKYKKVYTQSPKAKTTTLERVKTNVPELLQEVKDIQKQRQVIESNIREKVASKEPLSISERAYLDNISSRKAGMLKYSGGIEIFRQASGSRSMQQRIERPQDYRNLINELRAYQGKGYRDSSGKIERVFRDSPREFLRDLMRLGYDPTRRGNNGRGIERITPDYRTPDYRTPDYTPPYLRRPPGTTPPRTPGGRQPGPNPFDELKVFGFKSSKQEEDSLKGFIGEVKVRGKWMEADRRALTKLTALSKAARYASENAAASIRVREAGTKAVSTERDPYFILNQLRFRQSKRNKGVLVEKNKFRINSVGELNQITYQSNRRKQINLLRKMTGGF